MDTILYITPKDYVLESSEYHGISLLMEKDRMFGRKPETLESLLMRIRDTLWDLITISSKKDCPVCEGELRYFLAKQENHIEKIVLECASCTWTENLDGSEWKEGIIQFYPINKAELLKNGVQI
ncbi:MAG: hypothetical protein FWD46_00510 [Cystobacterineae bacterium]|nr:hypothetical protein [Cystobacterineae bacterium]